MSHITVDICTRDRYTDTLPLTLISVANQTVKPNVVIIYDDSTVKKDMREIEVLSYCLQLLNSKGIDFRVIWAHDNIKGQHIGHQVIQGEAVDLILRVDDDEVLESNVLEILLQNMTDKTIGAVGGLVLMPGTQFKNCQPNTISNLEDNCQWYFWNGKKNVEHLYSSYLYRKGIQDFDTNLSPVCHREETLHSYGIFKRGYKLIVDSRAVTWHFRCNTGGIRTGKQENWYRDEIAFQETLREYDGHKVVYLDCGMGDHLTFKPCLEPLKKIYKSVTLAVCYPELFPGENCISLVEGQKICNPEKHNIFKWCIDHNWKDEIKFAYAKMYGVGI